MQKQTQNSLCCFDFQNVCVSNAVTEIFLFNVLLPTIDIATDLFTFLTLFPDHPRWASIVLTWMFTSFFVHTGMFAIKRAKGKGKPFTTFGDLARDFYIEAGVHLPFASTFHNLWRMKILHKLKYGTREFKMRDHKEVEKILADAGKCSHAESMLSLIHISEPTRPY